MRTLISFSEGRAYKYFISSGMMGFDGNGATFAHKLVRQILLKTGTYDPSLIAETTKTITFHPIEGPKKIRPIKDGWWNYWGLDNPGLNKFLLQYGKNIMGKKNLIISIAGKDKNHVKIIISSLLIKFLDILAIELNTACSNHSEARMGANEAIKMCECIKKNFDIDLIAKVGKSSNHYKMIAKETEGLVTAIRINSVPADGGGAISGKRAQAENWRILNELLEASSTPVIAPSVWDYEDIGKVLSAGASGIDFGSVSMIHPKRPWGPAIPFLWSKRHKKEREARTYRFEKGG